MATTIDTGFGLLKSFLEITDDQRLAIVAHQGEIERILSKGFDTHGTELSGAYSRNTMIAVQKGATVDMFLFLRANYAKKHTPAELLDKLQGVFIEYYKDACINSHGNGVIVPVSDYMFNIVPCFHKHEKGYVIPIYKKDQWIKTNPNIYSSQLKKSDKQHKGHLLPIIRIIKCWNHAINNMFDEYYLELLVYRILTDVPITTYSSAVRYVFKEARREVVFTINDPAGFNTEVRGLKDAERLAEAMISFHEAYKSTLKAGEYEHEGELDLAYKEWESIFTGYFPTILQMLIQELKDSGIEGVKALKIIRDRTN